MVNKPPIDIAEAEEVLGKIVVQSLQNNYSFLKNWMLNAPIDMRDGEPIVKITSRDLERARSMLEIYGVPPTRTKYVSTGIDVLGTRYQKEIEALVISPTYAARRFIAGEISAGKLAESLGLNAEEVSQFKKVCKAYD